MNIKRCKKKKKNLSSVCSWVNCSIHPFITSLRGNYEQLYHRRAEKKWMLQGAVVDVKAMVTGTKYSSALLHFAWLCSIILVSRYRSWRSSTLLPPDWHTDSERLTQPDNLERQKAAGLERLNPLHRCCSFTCFVAAYTFLIQFSHGCFEK